MTFGRTIKIVLVTAAITLPVIFLLKYQQEADPAGATATTEIIVQLIRIGLLVGVAGVVIWMIRRGVAQGMDDHRKGRR
jgi:hypothetical protein